MKFVGREVELKSLHALLRKSTASLVTLKGRRRIGKSRLIEEFAKEMSFYTFSGIPPTPQTTKASELKIFADQFSQQTGFPEVMVDDWSKMFLLLFEKVKTGRHIILLDEISWMGSKDPFFLGKLKTAWDLHFKKNTRLMLILCGSVSSWIEKNIINSTEFLGRSSLYMTLEELPLNCCNIFWGETYENISAYEKLKVLSVTGGVPRYLELFDLKKTAEANIQDLCFSRNGPLVYEFNHIFSDIFGHRSEIYKKIVQRLADGQATADELAQALNVQRTGFFDDYLNDLLLSGFIAKDYTWHLKTGKISKLNHFRLKDNYLRFYLKYIEPNRARIDKDLFRETSWSALAGFDTIMGFQFENLVLNNHLLIIQTLGIPLNDIVFANRYFQRKTLRHEGCQIDYLIQTRFNQVYICEIKFSRRKISVSVIDEIKEKIKRLALPKNFSWRPILIHVNPLEDALLDSDFFAQTIDFGELLTKA